MDKPFRTLDRQAELAAKVTSEAFSDAPNSVLGGSTTPSLSPDWTRFSGSHTPYDGLPSPSRTLYHHVHAGLSVPSRVLCHALAGSSDVRNGLVDDVPPYSVQLESIPVPDDLVRRESDQREDGLRRAAFHPDKSDRLESAVGQTVGEPADEMIRHTCRDWSHLVAGQMKPARPTPPWMGDRCRDMPGTRGQWDVMCDPGPIAGRAPSGSPSSVAARADGRLVACDVSASCLPLPGRPWHPILVMSQAGGAVVAATIQIDSLEPMLHRVAAELHLLGNTQAYFRARAAGRMPSDALRQACRRLYQQHAAWIRHVVQSYGVPAHAVDDCVQDVWLAVIGSLDAFDLDPRRGTFRGWLRAVIHHKVADFARRRARQPATRIDELTLPLCSDEPGPAETYEARRRVRILRETVDELDQEVSTTSYQVFARRWIEGLGVSRVASALNLSRNDVRTRTHRAKRKLKQLLEAKEVGGYEDS